MNASQKKGNEWDMRTARCDLPTGTPLLQAAVTQKQVPSRALDESLVAILELFSFAIFAAHAFDAYRTS
jgi:hypothetical protein